MKLDFGLLEGFVWDQGNLGHIKKHQVESLECEEVFLNKPLKVDKDTKHSSLEKRFQVLGQTNKKRMIFLSFTVRNNQIRVISARDQNRKERRQYE